MTWWLVTDFDSTFSGCVTARWVQAQSPEEAGDAALPDLEEAWRDGGNDEQIEHVFAIPIGERVALDVISVTRHSELQCCGGIGDGRHSAICPTFDMPDTPR